MYQEEDRLAKQAAMCSARDATDFKQQPERERYIPSQAGHLERIVSRLEESYGNLHDRLQSVRSEELVGAKEECGPQKDPQIPCPLAEHLRQQTKRIENVIKRIDYQLSALEL